MAVGLLLLLFNASLAHADSSCLGEPLLDVAWEELALVARPGSDAVFRLPVSPDRPDWITHAEVEISFHQSSVDGQWDALLSFRFPDPKPYGIPFTFQGAEFTWRTPIGSSKGSVDWSEGCQQPGRSLFPGGSFHDGFELPGSIGVESFSGARFRVWGSRN